MRFVISRFMMMSVMIEVVMIRMVKFWVFLGFVGEMILLDVVCVFMV